MVSPVAHPRGRAGGIVTTGERQWTLLLTWGAGGGGEGLYFTFDPSAPSLSPVSSPMWVRKRFGLGSKSSSLWSGCHHVKARVRSEGMVGPAR